MIKTAKILAKTLEFASFRWKSGQKKGAAKGSLMSMLRETVRDSIKTQSFGLQPAEKPKKALKSPKSGQKPGKQAKSQEKPKKRPAKFEHLEAETENPAFETIDLSSASDSEQKIEENTRKNSENSPVSAEKEPKTEDFCLDFLQFPWKFESSYVRQPEKSLVSPVPLTELLYESEVFSLIRNFLLSIADFDSEALAELLEPSFHRKLSKSLSKLKAAGHTIEVKNLRKTPFSIDISNVSTFFTVGLRENRLKNDASGYFEVKDANIGGVPCKNVIKKDLRAEDRSLVILQVDCSIESEIAVRLLDRSNRLVRESTGKTHLFRLETVLLDEKYEDLTRISVELGQNRLDLKAQARKRSIPRFYLIDFDEFMGGNPLLSETLGARD